MVIKDNFNKKDVNPLDDYVSVGKGSHSLDREFERERQGFIKENMNNKVLEDLRENHDVIDDKDEDEWKLFR